MATARPTRRQDASPSPCPRPASPASLRRTLRAAASSNIPTGSGAPCEDWFSQKAVGFVLRARRLRPEREIHRDDVLPRSRGCPADYRIQSVYIPFQASDIASAVALISVYAHGFEGLDRRFIAVRSPDRKSALSQMALTPEESRRYARHLVLKGLGAPGQQKLKAARVLIVGAGGLGSPLLAYLAAAGVGHIAIADRRHGGALQSAAPDRPSRRRGSATTRPKAPPISPNDLNSGIDISALPIRDRRHNGPALMADYDIVADGTDTFEARAEIAEAAEAAQKPLVAGAVSMFDGQVTVFAPHLTDATATPCRALPIFIPKRPIRTPCPPARRSASSAP